MTTEVQIDPKRATDYETVFILKPDIDGETSEKVLARVVSAIESRHGRVTRVESWGKRRLSYTVRKQRKGFYVYVRYLGFQGTVAELERNLRMLDMVLRYMTVAIAYEVDLGAVVVDPEEVKVRRIEPSADDDEREESFEAQLGLSDDSPRRDRDRDRDRDREREREVEVVEAPQPEAEKPAGDA